MVLMGELDRQSVARSLFLTLTYPSTFPCPSQAKKHLDTFLKRLFRKYPQAGAVWKLEFQERGAPHFHLEVLGVDFIPAEWVARSWFEICGYGELHPEHLKAGTQVERVRSYRQAMSYVAKYLGKEVKVNLSGLGRVWGRAGQWRAYLSQVVTIHVGYKDMARLGRTLDGLRRATSRTRRKFRRRDAVRQGRFWLANVGAVWPALPRLLDTMCLN